MNKQFLFLLLLILIGTSIACQSTKNESSTTFDAIKQDTLTFFSLKNYFGGEAKRLQKNRQGLEKSLLLNEAKETKQLVAESIDWAKELHIFSSLDINKTAWLDKYSVDTLTEGEVKQIEYINTTKDLRTRKITVQLDAKGRIDSIVINNLTENVLYTAQEELHYTPQKGYYISTEQKVKFLPDDIFAIRGTFK